MRPLSLRLTITSAQRQSLGAASVKVVSGGSTTIGRAPGNDWILADSQGVVSRQHARIDRQGAEYVLTDTSVNGTYVNDSPEPIGNGRSHRLAPGDQILIGDYVIVASIEATEPGRRRSVRLG